MKNQYFKNALILAALSALPTNSFAQDKTELLVPDTPPVVTDSIAPQLDGISFRIRFGLKDAAPSDWSGSVTVSAGKVAGVSGWRWTQGDKATGEAAWTLRTRRQQAQTAAERRAVNQNGRQLPVTEAGVIVRLTDASPDSTVNVQTAAGNFTFKPSDVPYGERFATLNGGAIVERVPPVGIAATTTDDEDYPAAVRAADGTVYVTYVAFTRGKDFQGVRERVATPNSSPETLAASPGAVRKIEKPEDFEYLRQPSGGDRVLLKAYKDGKWSTPVDIGAKTGTEFYRPAVSIDGAGKVWVFYSAHQETNARLDSGNWELVARPFNPTNNEVGEAINLSHSPGSDFEPAATTDSTGRVWVTWIGNREKNFNVLVANQVNPGGAEFTAARRVSHAAANEWEPAIAADKSGHVTIGWDTYAKGDYDVYISTQTADTAAVRTPEAIPVAATLKFEGRPSLAYDKDGKLWAAYELGGDGWGKDFGAEEGRRAAVFRQSFGGREGI
ncbi:MAG: hypothetical protein QM754_16040 [Tepidisphaeraceae bacterium]